MVTHDASLPSTELIHGHLDFNPVGRWLDHLAGGRQRVMQLCLFDL